MMALLRLVPWPVWLAGGGIALAAVAATGVVIYQRGQVAYKAKVDRSLVQWEREQDQTNRSIDERTNQADGELIRKLGELERKWSAPPPSSPAQ